MIKTLIPIMAIIFCISGCASKSAQGTGENLSSIQTALEDQRYIFKARTAIPSGGRNVQLTTDYNLTVLKDSVIAYLPYFGRAYSAPLPSARGGIQFTSTDFKYETRNRRNGVREINIKPNDAADVQQLILSLSRDGYGSLQVTSNNRQSITFNGVAQKIE